MWVWQQESNAKWKFTVMQIQRRSKLNKNWQLFYLAILEQQDDENESKKYLVYQKAMRKGRVLALHMCMCIVWRRWSVKKVMYETTRIAMNEQNKIKTKRNKKPLALYYCFDGVSFAGWIYFVHISWAQTTCECGAFPHTGKISFFIFSNPFSCGCFAAATVMLLPPPMGILLLSFFPHRKRIRMTVCLCNYPNRTK